MFLLLVIDAYFTLAYKTLSGFIWTNRLEMMFLLNLLAGLHTNRSEMLFLPNLSAGLHDQQVRDDVLT